MNDAELERKAQELLKKAEGCFDSEQSEQEAYNAITDELNNLSPDERFRLALRMDALNSEHIVNSLYTPMIRIETEFMGGEQLDVASMHIGHLRPVYDPRFWLEQSFEYIDLFNIRKDKW